jgi:hypothetical protein
MRLFWAISRWAFVGLLVMSILMVAAIVLLPDFRNRADVGCYWTSDLIAYIKCGGFLGSGALGFILNLPLLIFLYGPGFLWFQISTGTLFDHAAKAPLSLLLEVLAVCLLAVGPAYPLRWLILRFRRLSQA